MSIYYREGTLDEEELELGHHRRVVFYQGMLEMGGHYSDRAQQQAQF